jgi:hypothetical protein
MNTEGEIQLNNVLQREVAELHQAIGKLTGRIISLERKEEMLDHRFNLLWKSKVAKKDVTAQKVAVLDDLIDRFADKMLEIA